ncbi:MAG: hypothetical protein U0736_17925 [Gemmataceae bacterium]
MLARIVVLFTAGLAFAALAGIPARRLAGDLALLHCLTAVALCLVPALLTLVWVRAASRDPNQAPLVALGASGVRMFVVLLAALALYLQVPPFQQQDGFLVWVLAAYLYLLAVEVVLLVRGRNPERPPPIDPAAR